MTNADNSTDTIMKSPHHLQVAIEDIHIPSRDDLKAGRDICTICGTVIQVFRSEAVRRRRPFADNDRIEIRVEHCVPKDEVKYYVMGGVTVASDDLVSARNVEVILNARLYVEGGSIVPVSKASATPQINNPTALGFESN